MSFGLKCNYRHLFYVITDKVMIKKKIEKVPIRTLDMLISMTAGVLAPDCSIQIFYWYQQLKKLLYYSLLLYPVFISVNMLWQTYFKVLFHCTNVTKGDSLEHSNLFI